MKCTSPKRGPGRPPRPPETRRTERLALRLPPAAEARLRRLAARTGEDVTTVLERLITQATCIVRDKDGKLIVVERLQANLALAAVRT